jgi:glutamyl-tRNA reductase
MIITILGLNHHTAPVELRERLHISDTEMTGALKALREMVPEGMIFSTCNRFEVMAHQEELEGARELLLNFISTQRNIPREEFERYLYFHLGSDALRHVFRVTSSLDSMVVGEPQILGQMKTFYNLAHQEKAIGFTLNTVMERAFAVAKKVRSETMIAASAVSVSSVAVELACKIFGRLDGKTALIIGSGKMSLLSIRNLKSKGIRLILITNRTFQKAAELAEKIKGRAVPFEDLQNCLAEADIVISSTGSSKFLIKKEDAQKAIAQRKNRPVFFIDIAVPRDIDPQINQIENIFLYDIDDLKSVAESNRKERAKEAEKAEEIVLRESEIFWNKLKSFDIAPTIREIQNQIEMVRQQEIQRTMKKLGSLSPEQKEAIDELTSSLTNKILQSSFAELRELANQPDGVEKIELIKKIFRK